MKLIDEAKKVMKEFSPERLGFAGNTTDDSGIRAKGVIKKPINRGGDYPYDKDISYGSPQVYDRGSNHSGELHHSLTPKDTEHFSLTLLDLEELVKEVMGSPMSMTKSNTSQLGSSNPGSSSSMGWSRNPIKDWDEEEEIDEGPLNIDTSPPDTEITPNSDPFQRDQTDDDLETQINRLWGLDDNPNFKLPVHALVPRAPDPYMSGLGGRLTSRGLFGLIPKESSWDGASRFAWKVED